MSIVERIALLGAIILLCATACSGQNDETRLMRKEILYNFEHLADDCVAVFGAGAIPDTTPAETLALFSDNLDDLSYIGIKGGQMRIDLPWPYEDIEVPVAMERNRHAYRITGAYGKIALTFTSYALSGEAAVLRIDGKFCHAMPYFLKEHVLATCIKNIVRTIRGLRD